MFQTREQSRWRIEGLELINLRNLPRYSDFSIASALGSVLARATPTAKASLSRENMEESTTTVSTRYHQKQRP